eukprot:gene35015-45325_t
MTKANTGSKSRDKKAVKVAGSNDVGVKVSTRPKRASSKIREELREKFAEEEKSFDDLLLEFQAEAASRTDEKAVLDSYSRQELEMKMAFEGTVEYADSIKEARAEILHKTEHPSSAAAATEIHQLEYDLNMMEQKEAIRAKELAGILHVNEVLPPVGPKKKSKVVASTVMVVAPPVVLNDMDISGAEESDDDDGEIKSQQSGVAVAAAKANATANRSAATSVLLGSSRPSMFSGLAIASGFDYLYEHKDLLVPDVRYPESRFLDRIQISSLQPSMLTPILVFDCKDDEVDWAYLQPLVAAVYAVIADGRDGVTTLMLVYAEHKYSDADQYPLCLSFECTAESAASTILVYSDLTISSHAIDPAIRQAIALKGISNPIAPSTPCSSRITTVQVGANGVPMERTSSSKNSAEWIPLRRALHGDKSKIAFFTRGEVDAKISGNAAILTRIRNQGKGILRLMSLPVMQAPLLVKLLTMTFCVTIDYTGTSTNRTPDALHICMFMESPSPGVYFKFTTSKEIIEMFDNMERVTMSIFQQKYGDPNPHYSRIFLGIKDSLRDEDPDTGIQNCSINYQVWKIEEIVVAWSEIYSNEENASMSRAEFLALNIKILSINQDKWRKDHGEYDRSRIPAQIISSAAVITKIEVAEDVRGGKYPRYSRGEQRAYNRGAGAQYNGQPRVTIQPGIAGGLGAGRGTGRYGGGRGGGGQQQGAANRPAAIPVNIAAPKLVGAGGVKGGSPGGLCLRDMLHAKDPASFPSGCMIESTTGIECKHRHGIQLTSGGKLNPADKADALRSLKTMQDPVAEECVITNQVLDDKATTVDPERELSEGSLNLAVCVQGNEHRLPDFSITQLQISLILANRYKRILCCSMRRKGSERELSVHLSELIISFSRSAVEAAALEDADNYEIP